MIRKKDEIQEVIHDIIMRYWDGNYFLGYVERMLKEDPRDLTISYRLNKDFIDLDSIPLVRLYYKSILDYLFKEEREVGFEFFSRDVSYDYYYHEYCPKHGIQGFNETEVIKSLAEQIISSCCIENREKFLTSLIAVSGYHTFFVICNVSKEDSRTWEDYLNFVEKEVKELCSVYPEKAVKMDANLLRQYIEELCNAYNEEQKKTIKIGM